MKYKMSFNCVCRISLWMKQTSWNVNGLYILPVSLKDIQKGTGWFDRLQGALSILLEYYLQKLQQFLRNLTVISFEKWIISSPFGSCRFHRFKKFPRLYITFKPRRVHPRSISAQPFVDHISCYYVISMWSRISNTKTRLTTRIRSLSRLRQWEHDRDCVFLFVSAWSAGIQLCRTTLLDFFIRLLFVVL